MEEDGGGDEDSEENVEQIVLTGEELERSLDPIVGFMIEDMLRSRLPLDKDH